MLMSYKQAVQKYGEENLVKILNPQQVLKYIRYVQPVAYMSGYDEKDVYVFLKKETNALYTLWKEHAL